LVENVTIDIIFHLNVNLTIEEINLVIKTHLMKFKLTFIILCLIPFYVFGQNVGVGQPAPSHTLHVTPPSGSDPIRIDGLQVYGMADTSIMMVNPTTGVVKRISPADLVQLLGLDFTGGSGITISGTTISNSSPDVPISLTGTGAVSISGIYPNFTINGTDNVNDADAVIGNEYNTGATLSGTTLSITDGGGSQTVNLSALQDGVNDADSVIGNEYNTGATLTGTTLSITDGGGSKTVNLSALQDGVNDADAVVGNEYNTNVTLSGTTLNVIDGGGTKSVSLAGIGGDITGVTAGAGLTGGGTSGTPTITAAAENGLYVDALADRIKLGGNLTESTVINHGTHTLIHNLNSTGDWLIRDNGLNRFGVLDNGTTVVGSNTSAGMFNVTGESYFSDDLYLRDGSVNGFNLVRIHDSSDDGIIDVYRAGGVVNRIHGNGNSYINAGNLGIGTNNPGQKLHVVGTGRFTDLAGTGNKLVMSDINGDLRNTSSGFSGQVLTSTGNGFIWKTPVSNDAWLKTGNAWTNPASNFVGTTDNQPLVLKSNNQTAVTISPNTSVGLGGVSTQAKLFVKVPNSSSFKNGQIIEISAGTSLSEWSGETKIMQTESTDNGIAIGDKNIISGSGGRPAYGVWNEHQQTGTGLKVGVNNEFGNVPGEKYGVYNTFNGSSGSCTGVINNISNFSTSTTMGVRNELANTGGIAYGNYNYIGSTGTSTAQKYGVYTAISGDGAGGTRYGSYNSVLSSAGSIYEVYGVYAQMGTLGTGNKFAGYFDSPQVGINSYAAVFNRGNVVANESGGNYDFRIETQNESNAFWVDASEDLVNFGKSTALDYQNGLTVGGLVVDYVADFDNSAEGTAIGIGTVEYLLDGAAETRINNTFSPAFHLGYDLGFTVLRAWDDVFADDFVNVSDRREKNTIENLNYGLSEIMAMRPVSYKLNKDQSGETKLGLIAQEVLPLVKEAVKTHDHKILNESTMEFETVEMERMGMKYQQLIPVLIKATQEQQEVIELVKKTTEDQRKTIELLKKTTEDQQKTIDQLQKDIIIQRNIIKGKAEPIEAKELTPTSIDGK